MSDRTFNVTIPDIGDFAFRKRVMRDQIGIEAEAIRILGGPTADRDLHSVALAMATLALLTVTAPKGWDVQQLDPLDPSSVKRLWAVYGGLRAEEDRFRAGVGA